MRFFKRSRHNNAADDPILAELKKAGVDLVTPRLVEHFIYVPTESAARTVAGELSVLGYETDVHPSPTGTDWTIVATHVIAPTRTEIARVRAELTAMAEAARGDYDGWGTPLDK